MAVKEIKEYRFTCDSCGASDVRRGSTIKAALSPTWVIYKREHYCAICGDDYKPDTNPDGSCRHPMRYRNYSEQKPNGEYDITCALCRGLV